MGGKEKEGGIKRRREIRTTKGGGVPAKDFRVNNHRERGLRGGNGGRFTEKPKTQGDRTQKGHGKGA